MRRRWWTRAQVRPPSVPTGCRQRLNMHSKSADPLGGAPRVPGTNLDTVYGFGRSPLAGPADRRAKTQKTELDSEHSTDQKTGFSTGLRLQRRCTVLGSAAKGKTPNCNVRVDNNSQLIHLMDILNSVVQSNIGVRKLPWSSGTTPHFLRFPWFSCI